MDVFFVKDEHIQNPDEELKSDEDLVNIFSINIVDKLEQKGSSTVGLSSGIVFQIKNDSLIRPTEAKNDQARSVQEFTDTIGATGGHYFFELENWTSCKFRDLELNKMQVSRTHHVERIINYMPTTASLRIGLELTHLRPFSASRSPI